MGKNLGKLYQETDVFLSRGILYVFGNVRGEKKRFLMDSGSNISLMNKILGSILGFKFVETNSDPVEIFGGRRVNMSGILVWEFEKHVFSHDMKASDFRDNDIVLGSDWMYDYSPVVFDFRNATISLFMGDEFLVLKGVFLNPVISALPKAISDFTKHSIVLKGYILERNRRVIKGQIHVMLDTGSEFSCINTKVAEKMGLEQEPMIRGLTTSSIDGIKRSISTKCVVNWRIHDCDFKYDLLVTDLGSHDILLGVDWMSCYSPVAFDYKLMKLCIRFEGENYYFQGEIPDGHPAASKRSKPSSSADTKESSRGRDMSDLDWLAP